MDEKDGEELLDYLAVTYSCLNILLSRGETSMYCEQLGTGVQSRMFGVLAWFPGVGTALPVLHRNATHEHCDRRIRRSRKTGNGRLKHRASTSTAIGSC